MTEQVRRAWELSDPGPLNRAIKRTAARMPVATAHVKRSGLSLQIRLVSPTELESLLPALVELLRDTVNGGMSMSFLPPLTHDEARDYWLSLRPELQAGSRLLLAAYTEDGIVGSGQLSLSPWPNSRHRAELQKLFVATALRGRGVGKSLMAALHDAARRHGRSLLLLNTRRGEPSEAFYKGLGYGEVGVIPGWTVGSAGERYDHVTLYQELSL
jgi:acetyltransferase